MLQNSASLLIATLAREKRFTGKKSDAFNIRDPSTPEHKLMLFIPVKSKCHNHAVKYHPYEVPLQDPKNIAGTSLRRMTEYVYLLIRMYG